MLEWLTTITNEGIALARVVVVLIAIVSIATVWYRTKALIPVLGAILVAGIALWAVSPAGIATIEDWIGQDAQAHGPSIPSPQPGEPVWAFGLSRTAVVGAGAGG